MRPLLALLALLFATAAQAQQRQPANVSTLPQSSPQEFDLLDNTGRWMPFGTASNGVWQEVWSDAYLSSGGSDCGSVKAAYAALRSTGGVIRLPNRVMAMGSDCQILVNGAPVQFLGQGWNEAQDLGAQPVGSTTPARYGTWMDISDTSKSLFLVTSDAGSTFDNIAFTENPIQPRASATTGVAWTPTVVPPVIDDESTGGYFRVRQILCDGVYACFKAYNTGGRVVVDGLFGQTFSSMIDLDNNRDVNQIDSVNDGVTWYNNRNVMRYTNQNADTLLMGRVDTPMIGRVFGVSKRSILHLRGSTNGNTTRGFANQLMGDGSKWTLWADSTVSLVTFHIGMLDGQHDNYGYDPPSPRSFPGSSTIQLDTPVGNHTFQIDQMRSQLDDGPAINSLNSAANQITIGSWRADTWAQGNHTDPVVGVNNSVANPSAISVARFFSQGVTNANFTNATTDSVVFRYQNIVGFGGAGATLNADMLTSTKGIGFATSGSIAGTAGSISPGNVSFKGTLTNASAFFQSGPGGSTILGENNPAPGCGLWVRPSAILPGKMDGSSAGCAVSYTVGNSTTPFTAVNATTYQSGAAVGFSGTKTAGTCVLTITGGIITNVTGC